jgi:single-stranded DNA-binding protein
VNINRVVLTGNLTADPELRPTPSGYPPRPLVTVGTVRTRFDDGSWVDVHDTLGTILMVAERSRDDPAFQYETRRHGSAHAIGLCSATWEQRPVAR